MSSRGSFLTYKGRPYTLEGYGQEIQRELAEERARQKMADEVIDEEIGSKPQASGIFDFDGLFPAPIDVDAWAREFARTTAEREELEKMRTEETAKKKAKAEAKPPRTIRQARAKHYEIFSDEKDDLARGQKEAILKYIEFLGTANQVDVSAFEISAFEKKGKLLVNRAEVNKVFFSLLKKKPQTKKVVPVAALGPELLLRFHNKIAAAGNPEKNNATRAINDLEARIKNGERNLLQWKRNLSEHAEKLALILEKEKGNKENDFGTQLQAILNTGNFTLRDIQPSEGISFITRPINKFYFNKKQASNFLVPLGQFELIFFAGQSDGWTVKIKSYKDNIVISGIFHPHAADSTYCLGGELGERKKKAKYEQNFFDFIMIHWQMLADFEDHGDCYVTLDRFEQEYKKKLRGEHNGVVGDRDDEDDGEVEEYYDED